MAPITPIVNYKNAPYYIAKVTANWFKINFELPFEYNIKKFHRMCWKIKELNIQPTHKMLTLDVTNPYTYILINETIELITAKLKGNTSLDDITQN